MNLRADGSPTGSTGWAGFARQSPAGTSLTLGGGDPLVAGLNAALAATPGDTLPATVTLIIATAGSQPRQITMTRFDMTVTQAA